MKDTRPDDAKLGMEDVIPLEEFRGGNLGITTNTNIPGAMAGGMDIKNKMLEMKEKLTGGSRRRKCRKMKKRQSNNNMNKNINKNTNKNNTLVGGKRRKSGKKSMKRRKTSRRR